MARFHFTSDQKQEKEEEGEEMIDWNKKAKELEAFIVAFKEMIEVIENYLIEVENKWNQIL